MAGRPIAQTAAGRCLYCVLALSVALGVALNFTPVDAIKALYWSAVINGMLAAPVMVMLMLLVRNKKVMGDLVVRGWLYAIGWTSTVAMAFCIVGMLCHFLKASGEV
jgi:Mn2+/Fe2+ NRAMP family transporter